MRHRRRQSIALFVSLVTHVVTVGGFSGGFHCIPEFEVPEIELEFTEVELIDPDAIQGEDPQAEPEPPPPAPPVAEPLPTPVDPVSEEQKPPEPEKVEEPKEEKKFADKGTRADKLAPPTSTFYMLLVPKKIRRLPFKQQVLDIMAPLPDFELLIDKGRFDALQDFDHIVIASTDIRDWTQTFLAVDYTVSREEVKLAVERAVTANGEVIEWVDDGGLLRGNPRPADPEKEDADNRWFVFLEDDKAIYIQDRFLPNIIEGPAEDDRKTTGNFVASLAKVRRFAARQPKAGLQLVVKRLPMYIKSSNLPFKVPDELELSASAAKEPEILLRSEFANVVEAKAFLGWYDEIRAKVEGSFALKMQIGWVFDMLEIGRDGRTVEARGVFSTEQATMLMKLIADGSRKFAKKTPQEIEQMKRRRLEAIEARKGGKLPPSAIDPVPEPDPEPDPEPVPDAEPNDPDPPPAIPAAPPDGSPAEAKPTKTPAEGGVGGSVPR